MLWRQAICAAALAACAWAIPCASLAATTGGVNLGFGASYTAPDGTSCTHRGLDLAKEAGQSVAAPASGTVRFAGRVPGPHGGSVLAMTLETERGTVSLLPLAELGRQKGDRVTRGDLLGSLAESGDPSSEGPHLHMGLRRGDLYIDPAVLLEAPAPAPAPEVQPQPESSPQAATPRAAESRPVPHTAGAASSPVRSLSVGGSPAASGVSAAVAQAPAAMPVGVSLAPAAGAPVQSAAVRVPTQAVGWPEGAASTPSARLLTLAEKAVEAAIGWLRAAGALGFAGIAAAFAACALLLGRKALEGRVTSNPPVSDRLGTLLQQLRAGDTLRGLTPAPGTLPSQSRGRLAQRR